MSELNTNVASLRVRLAALRTNASTLKKRFTATSTTVISDTTITNEARELFKLHWNTESVGFALAGLILDKLEVIVEHNALEERKLLNDLERNIAGLEKVLVDWGPAVAEYEAFWTSRTRNEQAAVNLAELMERKMVLPKELHCMVEH
ncbi:hypothetical protein K470DRAFT_254641 [Piedraia hortae CBS 480.64]|uniref:Prion-inhibition and propagation HeLo domain-containing protein n=1 Tax=Piedraia hortae CBS 480.64 TaxID=1314780 RepID=A0A6A7C8I2_9PEZI|nr:hypothetical protein K470DRAFT_254641 [Piedraia hortae CBS 480.64]